MLSPPVLPQSVFRISITAPGIGSLVPPAGKGGHNPINRRCAREAAVVANTRLTVHKGLTVHKRLAVHKRPDDDVLLVRICCR